MSETCQRCNEEGEDRRTLWMACFYDMGEMGLPFVKEALNVHEDNSPVCTDRHFYTLRVCKDCRADWMKAIKLWFENPVEPESCDSGIYVREFGANVEISEDEFQKRYPGVVPTRVIKDE